MARSAIAIALPADETAAVVAELIEAGFEALPVASAGELDALLADRPDVAFAVLDGDAGGGLQPAYRAVLERAGRSIPTLVVLSPETLDRLATPDHDAPLADELLVRPFSTESLRWRIEAMSIRAGTANDGADEVMRTGDWDTSSWGRRAAVVAVFNPKGGVGKTTVATNVAAALQAHRGQHVLLVDADTVTGHVTTSLGLEHVRTVTDSWADEAEGAEPESFADVAAPHPSGMRVIALTSGPLHDDLLDPRRVADAIDACRHAFNFIVVDLHPSYSRLNRAIFERADRILVPVTPDVPALRAAVQMRDVAVELGIRERLALIVNRAHSGVSVRDMERTVGMPAFALIRSAGLQFVRAANEGRTVSEMFPGERVAADFDALADRLLGAPIVTPAARLPLRLFGRAKDAVRPNEPLRA